MIDENNRRNIELANINRAKLVPFLGSGTSCPFGLPSWNGLIQSLAEIAGIDKNDLKGRPGEKIEFIKNKLGSARFNSEIKINLGVDKRVSTRTLQVLASARIRRMITTNLDNAIENSVDFYSNNPIEVISARDECWSKKFLSDDGIQRLFKIHGTIDFPDSWVLTEEEYERSYLSNDNILELFKNEEFVPLFVGFGFSDPDISYMLRRFGWEAQKEGRFGFAIVTKEVETLERYGIRQIVIQSYDNIPEIVDAIFNGPKLLVQTFQTLWGQPIKMDIGPLSIDISKLNRDKVDVVRKIISNALDPLPNQKILAEGFFRKSGPRKDYIYNLGTIVEDNDLFGEVIAELCTMQDVLFHELLPHLVNNSSDSKKLLWPTLQSVVDATESTDLTRTRKLFVNWMERLSVEPGVSYSSRKALVNTLANRLNRHQAKDWPPVVVDIGGLTCFKFPITEAQVAFLRKDDDWEKKSIKPYLLRNRGEANELVDLVNKNLSGRSWRLPSTEDWLRISGLVKSQCPPWPWGLDAPEPRYHAHLKFARTGGAIADEVVECGLFPKGLSTTGLVDLVGNAYELVREFNGDFKLAGGAFTTIYGDEDEFEIVRKYIESEEQASRNNVCVRLVSTTG